MIAYIAFLLVLCVILGQGIAYAGQRLGSYGVSKLGPPTKYRRIQVPK